MTSANDFARRVGSKDGFEGYKAASLQTNFRSVNKAFVEMRDKTYSFALMPTHGSKEE
jgi:hypothetical protein